MYYLYSNIIYPSRILIVFVNIVFIEVRVFTYNINNDYEKYLNLILEQLNYYKFILFYNEKINISSSERKIFSKII